MSIYRQGYEVYVNRCQQFGLEPINFSYFVIKLSKTQLEAYNTQAAQERMD